LAKERKDRDWGEQNREDREKKLEDRVKKNVRETGRKKERKWREG
jgi:hypothetical protein